MFLCPPCHARTTCELGFIELQSRGPCESCHKSDICADCHYTSPAILAQVQAMAKAPNHNKYFLAMDDHDWGEVTKEDFVKAERLAGFHNTLGMPEEPATAGFGGGPVSGHTVRGKVEYHA